MSSACTGPRRFGAGRAVRTKTRGIPGALLERTSELRIAGPHQLFAVVAPISTLRVASVIANIPGSIRVIAPVPGRRGRSAEERPRCHGEANDDRSEPE